MFDHNKFDNDFARHEKRFNFVWRLAIASIIIAFLLTVAFWAAAGFGIYKVGSQVGQEGLKPVVEKIWCGEKGCK